MFLIINNDHHWLVVETTRAWLWQWWSKNNHWVRISSGIWKPWRCVPNFDACTHYPVVHCEKKNNDHKPDQIINVLQNVQWPVCYILIVNNLIRYNANKSTSNLPPLPWSRWNLRKEWGEAYAYVEHQMVRFNDMFLFVNRCVRIDPRTSFRKACWMA